MFVNLISSYGKNTASLSSQEYFYISYPSLYFNNRVSKISLNVLTEYSN